MAFNPGFAWRRGVMGLGAIGRSSTGRAIVAGRHSVDPIISKHNDMLAYRRGKRRIIWGGSGAAVLGASRHVVRSGPSWPGYGQTSTGSYGGYY